MICPMPAGWLVLGDVQVLRGYCLLLPDPVVPDLNSLASDARRLFLNDMAIAGDALLQVTGASRINYEILGNLEPALHAHLFPRYADEPDEFRQGSVWFYDRRNAPAFDLERDRPLMDAIAQAIAQLQSSR